MTAPTRLILGLLAPLLISLGLSADTDHGLSDAEVTFFETKIRPILAESCYECHNSLDKRKGDLALDYRTPLISSGVIVPGDPDASILIQSLRHADDAEAMPDKAPKLANLVIKNFEDWVRMGAPDPRTKKPTKEELASQVDWPTVRENRKAWWSFQPLKASLPPPATDPDWDQTAIDRFLFAGFAEKNLSPQAPASAGTLVRRLHLVLTGLPPSPEVVNTFVANPSQAAYETLVDELMASTAYGERWGRYWMDWFRYAESYGSEGDPAIPHASRYRDYVIRAIQKDVPYDQLIREHLAGDLLDEPRIDPELGLNESAIGLAHIRMAPHGFGVTDAYEEQITFTDNQVDVISKAMLGLTVSCARCHNHKFDPISHEDFYRFYGILVSSRPAILNVDSPELQDLHKDALAEVKQALRPALAGFWLGDLDRAIAKLEAAELDEVPASDPLHAWSTLRDLDPPTLQAELATMRIRYQDQLAEQKAIKARATFYADLTDPETYERWFKTGNGIDPAVSPAGSFAIAPEGARAVSGIYPAGVYTHLISDKHNATLQSVFHQAKGTHNTIRAMGEGAMARFVMRSYPLSHGLLHPAAALKPEPNWTPLRKYTYWNGEKGYYNIVTAGDKTFRPSDQARSWFGVYEVYAGDEKPIDLGTPFVTLHSASKPIANRDELLAAFRAALEGALSAWQTGHMSDPQAALLNSCIRKGFLINQVDALPQSVSALITQYRSLESEVRPPTRVPGVFEGEVWDQPLLDRGDHRLEKNPVTRSFLEAFPGEAYPADSSGRRELAEDILREGNPLTSRVIVNRLWHHTFGRGLVASADNFGRLGKPPSHPELLDFLAMDFRLNGWSMKRTVRQLVTSRAFRSDSFAPIANADRDPENLQLAYFTPRRLDAEAILDTIRFVSASASPQRAIYTRQARNSRDPFLKTFNHPVPTTTVGVRDLTNVPAQSLTLLNGKIAQNAAVTWGKRIEQNGTLQNDEARIRQLFLEAYARPPRPEELAACLTYIGGKIDDDSQPLRAEHQAEAAILAGLRRDRNVLLADTRSRLQSELDARNTAARAKAPKPVDLKPIAHWNFKNQGKDQVGSLHGKLLGNATFVDGALELRGGCMMTEPLDQTLTAKTLEVLVQLDNPVQKGGGAMTIQTTDGSVFDSIVYAELDSKTWLAGSDHHRRSQRSDAPPDQESHTRPVRIAIVYEADGTIQMYRDGLPYGTSYQRPPVSFEAGKAQIVFGLRHGTGPSPGRALTGTLYEARLYDRALRPEEVQAAMTGLALEVLSETMIIEALSPEQQAQLGALGTTIAQQQNTVRTLKEQLSRQEAASRNAGTPWTRLAHALINSKELIYVY